MPELRNLKFTGKLTIQDDNRIYIDVDLPIELYELHNYFLESNTFTVLGKIEEQNITLPFMFRQKMTGIHVLLKGSLMYFGTFFVEEDLKIKIVSAKFTGFTSYLSKMPENFTANLPDSTISFYQDFDDRKENNQTGIKTVFNTEKDIETVIEYLNDVNSFFSLLHNIPSQIKNILITTNDNKSLGLYVSWLPLATLHQPDKDFVKACSLEVLPQKLIKWLDFANNTKIACEQYFALQTLNKKFYSQMTLYTALFAFEGFINEYNKQCCSDTVLLKKEIHEKICREKLFPFIDSLANISDCFLPQDYIDSLKDNLKFSYNKTFRKRLNSFFSAHQMDFAANFEKLGITQKEFITRILAFRNTYAHDSDDELDKVAEIKNSLGYYFVINKAIRILLLKDYLKIMTDNVDENDLEDEI